MAHFAAVFEIYRIIFDVPSSISKNYDLRVRDVLQLENIALRGELLPLLPVSVEEVFIDLSGSFWRNRPRRGNGVLGSKQTFSQKICPNIVKFSQISANI